MTKQKTLAPDSDLFDQSYKLSYFCEELSKYVENQAKSIQSLKNVSNTLNCWFKKDIFHMEMLKPYCSKCYSKNVIKNGTKTRKLYFHDKGLVKAEVQVYKCKKCGKTFKTDISQIVKDNCNFTHDFRSKSLELEGLFFGSIRNIAYKLEKDTGISVSRQSIENWILEHENDNNDTSNRYSGYYIFDSQWVKIKGVWNYRLALYDSKNDIIIADEIYSEEDKNNITEFIDKNTRNKERNSITSDLDEKYKPIIEGLGFTHQWCLFHTRKNFNKTLKTYIKENQVNKDEKKLIYEEKDELFELFNCKTYQIARNTFNKMLNNIKEYSKVIQSILTHNIMPYFKTFFAYLLDKNIERTSNKLENKFQITFPKSIKRIMKIKKGAMSRINIRKEILNQKNVFDTQTPSF
jgi:hypothetical protein